MRRLATGLLVIVALLFVLARSLESSMPGWAWVRAFSEAAMVGALADWFAVTALFRHPLGLPIPHTAVVKKEKARIGEALARFVRGSFLSPDEVTRQWQRWKPLDLILEWLSKVENAQRIVVGAVERLPRVIGKDGGGRLLSFTGKAFEKSLQSLPLGKLASIALDGFLKSPSRRAVMAPVLLRLGKKVSENKEWVGKEAARAVQPTKNRFFSKLARAASSVLSEKAVDKLAHELAAAGNDEDHPLYEKIEQALAETAQDFSKNDATQWLAVKELVMNDEETREMFQQVLTRAGEAILEGTKTLEGNGTLQEWSELIARGAQRLREDSNDLDQKAMALVTRIAEKHGSGIETLISETVAGWEADELINRLENQVGPDLQFIRINGTLIGGLVGLSLHALGKLIWN